MAEPEEKTVMRVIAAHPLNGQLDTTETIQLPAGSDIVRAGLNAGDQMRPAFWYTYPINNGKPWPPRDYTLVVVRDGAEVPTGFVHRGLWWVGNQTFHLFELRTALTEEGATAETPSDNSDQVSDPPDYDLGPGDAAESALSRWKRITHHLYNTQPEMAASLCRGVLVSVDPEKIHLDFYGEHPFHMQASGTPAVRDAIGTAMEKVFGYRPKVFEMTAEAPGPARN